MRPSYAVHLARGTSYIIVQNITTSAAMIVSFAILARIITPKEMGILAVLSLLSGLCQTTASLALPEAATRFVAEKLASGDKGDAAGVFYQALRTTLLLALPLGVALFVGGKSLSAQLLGDYTYSIYFQTLALDITINASVLPVLTNTMLGLQKFREVAAVGTVNALVRQSLIIVLILSLQNFVGLVIAWIIADLAASAIYAGYVLRELGKPRFDFPLRNLLKFSWPLYIGNAVSFAGMWFDRALLVAFVPLTTLGVYNVTITAFSVLVGITSAMTATLYSAYSAMQTRNHHQTLPNAVRLASRYVALVAVLPALGLMATAKPALTLFVGPAYEEGAWSLMILTGSFALGVAGPAVGPMLIALGGTRTITAITITSVALSLVAAFVLLPIWGILGAAVARGFTVVTGTLLIIYFLNRRIRVELDLEAIAKSLIAGTIMAAVVIGTQLVVYSKLLLPIYALVGVATYLLMLRLLRAVRSEDISVIRGYLGNRLAFASDLLSRILL